MSHQAASSPLRAIPPCSEAALFEQLMVDWDDAFAADCDDSERALAVAQLAEEGHRQHGRGEQAGAVLGCAAAVVCARIREGAAGGCL